MLRPIRQYTILIITVVLVITVTACQMRPPKYSTAGKDIQSTLNSSIQTDRSLSQNAKTTPSHAVENALLPPLSINIPGNMTKPTPHRFDVTANDMPAKNFFLGLVAGTHDNMIVSPSVTGTITLNLSNVTIRDALNAARDMYGYEYKKTDMGYEILSSKMTTEIFNINYLNINRNGQSQTQLISTDMTNPTNNNSSGSANNYTQPTTGNSSIPAARQEGSGTLVVTRASNDFWETLSKNLKTLIGTDDGRWVITNPQASVVMVHAYPKELHEVSKYLKEIQSNLQREVVIEAKILEITLSDKYQAGVNWKILGAVQGGSAGLPAAFINSGQIFKLSVNAGSRFDSVINLLSQQGNVQVLSSPHISTINNQEAVIKVGNDQFFVTGYTSNVTPTGSTNTTSQSVALNPFFSGITLDVTPQISSTGRVTLYIHPSISEVQSQDTTIQLGTSTGTSQNTLVLPLATSSIRESDDVVDARNGQIVVIGGLMQNATKETVAGTPGASAIPMLGALARNTHQTSAKTELVILLRAIVVNNHTWQKRLGLEAQRFQSVQRGFHAGGLPEDFGTEGEKQSRITDNG